MHRTQIYLDEAQMKLLRQVAKENDQTLSELIREAIWNIISRYIPVKKPSSLHGIIGLYRDETDIKGSTQHDDLYE